MASHSRHSRKAVCTASGLVDWGVRLACTDSRGVAAWGASSPKKSLASFHSFNVRLLKSRPSARSRRTIAPTISCARRKKDSNLPDETSEETPLVDEVAADAEAAAAEPQPADAGDETPAEDGGEAEQDVPDDDGPVHRPLIRATLPRPEGQSPERKAPDFTIRQPGGRGGREFDGNRAGGGGGQRHGRGHRAGARGPQGSFSGPSRFGGGPRQNSPQGGQRQNSNRPGPSGGGQRGGGRPQGQQRGPGRKRGR